MLKDGLSCPATSMAVMTWILTAVSRDPTELCNLSQLSPSFTFQAREGHEEENLAVLNTVIGFCSGFWWFHDWDELLHNVPVASSSGSSFITIGKGLVGWNCSGGYLGKLNPALRREGFRVLWILAKYWKRLKTCLSVSARMIHPFLAPYWMPCTLCVCMWDREVKEKLGCGGWC